MKLYKFSTYQLNKLYYTFFKYLKSIFVGNMRYSFLVHCYYIRLPNTFITDNMRESSSTIPVHLNKFCYNGEVVMMFMFEGE